MDLLAYIDPGTGSFLVQMLLGAFLGVGIAIKMSWRRIREVLARIFTRRSVEGDR